MRIKGGSRGNNYYFGNLINLREISVDSINTQTESPKTRIIKITEHGDLMWLRVKVSIMRKYIKL